MPLGGQFGMRARQRFLHLCCLLSR
jgi:hypothetical protein